jgi:4-aminobutyrate aminotransferase-like enzyme
VIEEEQLRERAARIGRRIRDGLDVLASRHDAIGDVRGLGMFLGVVLVRDRATRQPDGALATEVVEAAKARGVLLSTDGRDHDVVKIKPPLVWDDAEADRLVETLDGALTAVR